jgi:hypothetical protein
VRRISPARGAPRWRVSGGKEPPMVGRRSGGGRQLRGRGAVVSSGGSHGGEGGLGDGLSGRFTRWRSMDRGVAMGSTKSRTQRGSLQR